VPPFPNATYLFQIALRLLSEAARSGDWLCLKNLHLVTSWLPVLEKELNALTPHKRFRLWLTTESHPRFPPILLQQSLKLTFESPPGLKKNLQRTYETWDADFISNGSPQRAQLLFLLAWFHAIMQERRSYIPQGWTKFYEFSLSDLRSAANVVDMSLNQGGGSPDWLTLHGYGCN
jgi:dynein heavy chain 2